MIGDMTTPAPLSERETLDRYEKRGALLRGHFRLTSGLHSDIYLQSALVLQHPEDAAALGVRALFTEREDGVMRLRRGFTLGPGERCLVVEDVITTGGSTREVVQCVEALGGVVVGVGSLIDRSGGTVAFSVKRVALATVSAATYPPESCPLCQSGSPAIKPGSRS